MPTALVALLLAAPAQLTATPIALPPGGPVLLDYLAAEADGARIWVPAGDTGRVDVIDAATGKLTAIDGFETAKTASGRTMGPTSASAGDGVVYVGNRATSALCAIGARSLRREGCVTLTSVPDGVSYVASAREVWVTLPREKALQVVDAREPGHPVLSRKIALPGQPEGYAVDEGRGIFYTNLEDTDRTLAIDVRSRQIVATWNPGCGEAGPRGLSLDAKRGQLYVACTDAVKTLSTRDGRIEGSLPAGGGIDFIDYVEATRTVYIPSGKTATLTLARAGDQGELTVIATAQTAPGARVVVAGAGGAAYVADSQGGRILVVAAPKTAAP